MSIKVDADYIKSIRGSVKMDDVELAAALAAGWDENLPAIKDEHGVLLVGNRRMKLVPALGIKPVTKTVTFGTGPDADAARIRLANVSNAGGEPITAEDRKRQAELLYGGGLTQTAIATMLGVSQQQVAKYLVNLQPGSKLKSHSKTATNPKGAGRPKSVPKAAAAPKTRAQTAPQAVVREERAAVLMAAGKGTKEIAADLGIGPRAANQVMEHVKIRQEAEPLIDPAALPKTWREKYEIVARQERRRLEASFHRAVDTEVERRLRGSEERITAEARKHEQENHDTLVRARRIVRLRGRMFTKTEYTLIRACLHPDRVAHLNPQQEDHAKLQAKYHKAFYLFEVLKKLVGEEEPVFKSNVPDDLPSTRAGWDALKRKVKEERRTKRNGTANAVTR
jgi:DNA-binding CsgD family transcriptional regulator